MRLPIPTRGAALVAGVALTAAVAAALVFSALGGGPAAGATAGPTPAASGPSITPLAAALVPGPIDIDRKGRSNVVTVRIDFQAGDTTGWHFHPGPVLVQVVSGAVTLSHAAHGRCLSDVVGAGHGFFEAPGAVHVAANRRQGQGGRLRHLRPPARRPAGREYAGPGGLPLSAGESPSTTQTDEPPVDQGVHTFGAGDEDRGGGLGSRRARLWPTREVGNDKGASRSTY